MTETVIKIEDVSKLYRLGEVGTGTLYQDLNRAWAKLRGKPDPYSLVGVENTREEAGGEFIWALNNINMEVQQGEILGIIGRNGAGKSTLLKLMSRITAPTTGSIKLRGRVASLLEVGTGFHMDLTGRENIYLNGAILGMSRREINNRLEEIIEFSGCAKYINTPVKRYSSGMLVRLGFSVAAHLECEILIVDEVLAVGDAEFQKRCLGKMEDISSHDGRTVLFVSHNMRAMSSLCNRSLLLDKGVIVAEGQSTDIVNKYLGSMTKNTMETAWESEAGSTGTGDVVLLAMRLKGERISGAGYSSSNLPIVEMEFESRISSNSLCVGFDVFSADGSLVFRTYQTDLAKADQPKLVTGRNIWKCHLPRDLLNTGTYYLAPRIGIHKQKWIVHSDPVLKLDVLLTHGNSQLWGSNTPPGLISPVLDWTI